MFSLFRKDDPLQPLSQPDLQAVTPTPIGDPAVGDASSAEVRAPQPTGGPESHPPVPLGDPRQNDSASQSADDVLPASLGDDDNGSEAAEVDTSREPELTPANNESWLENLAEHRREHGQRLP